MLRNMPLKLSDSKTMRQTVTHFGPARRVARRFVAGETLAETVTVAQGLNRHGIKAILNEVGELPRTMKLSRPLEILRRCYSASKQKSWIFH